MTVINTHKTYAKFKSLLYGDNDIYDGFDHTKYSFNNSAGSAPIGADILSDGVSKENASVIIEIGTFLGHTAISMAKRLRDENRDGVVLCIDTWLGGSDHWYSSFHKESPLKRINGYPNIYYQFLANVCYENLQNYIIPIPLTSNGAYAILKENNVIADLVYVDGSHLYTDVYNDITNYYNLLIVGGVMIGDDWPCDDVKQAVVNVCSEKNIDTISLNDNQIHWLFKKC